MKKISSPLAVMALAIAASTSPMAQAASASSMLSDVYIQLFDLNPLDSITPSITLGGISYIYGSATDGSTSYFNNNGPIGTALSDSTATGGASSAAAVAAGNLFLVASGNGASSSANANGLNTNAYGQGLLHNGQFTVSAMTLVVVTATGQAAASAALGESAYASAYVGIQDLGGNNYSYGQVYRNVQTDGTSYGNGGPLALNASFVNLTAASQNGYFYATSYTSATGVTAVPEPGSYALMLAGILALGFVAKRRSQG